MCLIDHLVKIYIMHLINFKIGNYGDVRLNVIVYVIDF